MLNIKPKEQKVINEAQALIRQNNASGARDILIEYSKKHKLSQLGEHWLCLSYGISGDPGSAKKLAIKLSKKNPENTEYIKLLGNCSHDLKQFDEAISYFKKALEKNNNDFKTMSNLASSLKENKQYEEAETFFKLSLQIKADQPDAITNYGLLKQNLGEIDSAIELHQKVLKLNPTHLNAAYNLAHAIKEKGDKETALGILNNIINFSPNHLKSLCDAAILYIDLQKPEHAKPLLDRASTIEPNNEIIHLGFYYLHKTLNNLEKALSSLKEAIRLNPNNPTSKYLLAIAEGSGALKSSPDNYVQELFDTYAETFDSHLIDKLQYRTPELINSIIRKHINNTNRYNILDLGCGTGLAGVYLQDISNSMVGVDLSPKMIKKADERKIYNKLFVNGIEQYLDTCDFNPNIVISADVFVYIGDLEKTFSQLSDILEPGGYFVFSTESTNETESYKLRESGRFAHNRKYVEKLADENFFNLLETHETILRYEAGNPMQGHVYLLQKK